MKLLIIMPSVCWGGAEKYAFTIACAARKRGNEVCMAFPEGEKLHSFKHRLLKNGIQYTPINIVQLDRGCRIVLLLEDVLQFLRTLIVLRKKKPCVVQIVLPWPTKCLASMLACAWLNIATIVVFQLASHKVKCSPLRLRLYQWAFKRQQKWVAVSENNRSMLSQSFGISASKIQRIYNGVPFSNTDNDSRERCLYRKQICAELHLSRESIFVATVGRLHPQKGYDFLIPVIFDVLKFFPQAKFIWCGEGDQSYKKILLKKIQEYPFVRQAVILLGERKDVKRILSASDIFLFPSFYEGFSFALLEAMSYRVPVIASNIASNCEAISEDGAGLLFRTNDKADLLKKILWALRNRKQMSRMANRAYGLAGKFREIDMINETLGLWPLWKVNGKIDVDFT